MTKKCSNKALTLDLDWVSLVSLAKNMPSLLAERPSGYTPHPYDWMFGKYQYTLGLLVCFIGLVALEGAALSLASKASPPKLRTVSNHVGTMSVFLVLLSKTIADLHILIIELSRRWINVDSVNSLVLPSIVASAVALYFVKRHFFFLM